MRIVAYALILTLSGVTAFDQCLGETIKVAAAQGPELFDSAWILNRQFLAAVAWSTVAAFVGLLALGMTNRVVIFRSMADLLWTWAVFLYPFIAVIFVASFLPEHGPTKRSVGSGRRHRRPGVCRPGASRLLFINADERRPAGDHRRDLQDRREPTVGSNRVDGTSQRRAGTAQSRTPRDSRRGRLWVGSLQADQRGGRYRKAATNVAGISWAMTFLNTCMPKWTGGPP